MQQQTHRLGMEMGMEMGMGMGMGMFSQTEQCAAETKHQMIIIAFFNQPPVSSQHFYTALAAVMGHQGLLVILGGRDRTSWEEGIQHLGREGSNILGGRDPTSWEGGIQHLGREGSNILGEGSNILGEGSNILGGRDPGKAEVKWLAGYSLILSPV
ncbi:hypothetical protein E6O75_ATG05295 [Venturia nashicola]|uniref:Uncharacterized protein n=1 Tax=Venturia nashicola TaxID=86259 RepID=A0A4Z1P7N2_9PEZI|nr:hypothetical protein E6O75_ATG05295 [Venturia nashicola]